MCACVRARVCAHYICAHRRVRVSASPHYVFERSIVRITVRLSLATELGNPARLESLTGQTGGTARLESLTGQTGGSISGDGQGCVDLVAIS